MKIPLKLLAVLCAAFACAVAHAQSITLNSESEVTITGRLMSPSSGWGWGLTRAGVITIRDSGGTVVAEKIWQDANSGGENYVARDYSVTSATVSGQLALVTTLPAGSYTVSATGSYSQGSWGYLWIEIALSSTPKANRPPTVAWAHAPTEVPYTREVGKRYEDIKAAASDPDGDRVVVVLQRRVNGGEWISSAVKRGAYTNDATPGAILEWRAMATDSRGATSDWITWGPITVGP